MGQLHTNAINGNKTVLVAVVPTTALLVAPANLHRKSCLILNNSAVVIYLGPDATVTAATGFPLAPGAALPDSASGDAWYAIAASGTADVRALIVA